MTAIIIACLLLLPSAFLFFRGIVSKNPRVFTASIACVLIAGAVGMYGVFSFPEHRAKELVARTKFAPPLIAPNDDTVKDYVTYAIDPRKQDVKLYWKDDNGQKIRSIARLKDYLAVKNYKLLFAMNGGMYQTDNTPLGLFIQDGKLITRLNTRQADGNFYMKPNGVFYINNRNEALICRTEDFKNSGNIKYATQSGPMLLVDGVMHKGFSATSQNRNIRNGVGVLRDGSLLFAMSTRPVTFYEFASYFKEQGCNNALYLDGFVSRTYLPDQHWMQTDGNFGIIIACAVKQ